MGALNVGPGGNRERITARERRALTLRVVHRLSYSAIAASLLACNEHLQITGGRGDPECPQCERLYASPSSARRAVVRALERDYPAPTGTERALYVAEQLALLDRLTARMAVDMLDPQLDPGDRARAAGRVLDAARRKSDLLGLDAPKEVHVTAELDDEIEAAIEALRLGPALPELEGVVLEDDTEPEDP